MGPCGKHPMPAPVGPEGEQLQAHAPPALLSPLLSEDADTMWLRAVVDGSVAQWIGHHGFTRLCLCTGWVCYAEKTHGPLLLPHLSAVRSPQGAAGLLVKQLFCAQRGLDPARVYHVAIMPCFDKKLEASRPDLTTRAQLGASDGTGSIGASLVTQGSEVASGASSAVPSASIAETDCVLASNEVHALMVQHGVDLRAERPAALDPWLPPDVHNTVHTQHTHVRNGLDGGHAPTHTQPVDKQPHQSCSEAACCQTGSAGTSNRSEACACACNAQCAPTDSPGADGSCGSACTCGLQRRLKSVRGGSGGYLEYVLRYAARELFGQVRVQAVGWQ